jgi:exonuclease III
MNNHNNNLTILQYNVNHSSNKIQTPFLQQLNPKEHNIIAIQEPWINPQSKRTVNLPGYHTVLPDAPAPRVAFYISREISTLSWNLIKQTSDLITIQLQRSSQNTQIHNCYNPSGPISHHNQGTLPQVQEALQAGEGCEHILLGDFNLHHPMWGGHIALDQHWAADSLINITSRAHMELILPPGTITWETPRSCQTLDLVFATQGIQDSLQSCTVCQELETGSDHLPIRTTIQGHLPKQRTQTTRPQWKAARWDRIQAKIKEGSSIIATQPMAIPEQLDAVASSIQNLILHTIEEEVPKARPSQFAKMSWSTECSRMVKQTRALKRQWSQDRSKESLAAYLASSHAKGKQIKRDRNLAWRKTVKEITEDPTKIWKMAKWAREKAGKGNQLPQFPEIQDQDGNPQDDNNKKADALAAHFFPTPKPADLQDIQEATYPDPFQVDTQVRTQEVIQLLKHLPTRKAAGPDQIPNLLLKECREELSPLLCKFFTACIQTGHHPRPFKHSITVVLKKPQKPDYTKPGAYRPIALLNTLAKALEALVAKRISKEAEARGLLPDSQMGARPGRSTTLALELITEQVHTVWRTNPKMVASMLCLDISGAFDNVSHTRLIHNLKMKAFPPNITQFIQSFLQDRTTCLRLGGYLDCVKPQTTGIPQGSTLSPILFLFFASTLLPELEGKGVTAMGFVDDSNILAFGETTAANCRKLEAAHDKCLEWAAKHGAAFAPQKYQLIHFTRSRKTQDLQATVNIQGFDGNPVPDLRLLGVQVDSKLQWGPHIKKAAEKGTLQMHSLQRLCKSTWGASFQKAKHLYTAVIRPVLTFGAKVWVTPEGIQGHKKGPTKPLEQVQSQALRHISGAYRSVPISVLQQETEIPPIYLYTQELARQQAAKDEGTSATEYIQARCRVVARESRRRQARSTGAQAQSTKQAQMVHLTATQEPSIPQGRRTRPKNWWLMQKWEREWTQAVTQRERAQQGQLPPAAWTQGPLKGKKLHKGWSRPQSTMATLIRTEHIGLRAYLTRQRVPNITPECTCGYRAQTLKHIMLFCPERQESRRRLFQTAGSDWKTITQTRRGLNAATRWMIQESVLDQFSLAREEEERDRKGEGI